MPQRFLRPGIRTSPRWNSVSHEAHTLYIAILTLVDDYGRYDGRPSVLWAEAFAVWNDQNPDETITCQQAAALCQQLDDAKLVEFYEVDGRTYLQVVQWQERARSKSIWPEPSDSKPQRIDSKPQPPSFLVHRSSSLVHAAADCQQLKIEDALKWLSDWNKSGASYTEQETRGAFLALQAGGWMWGRNPISDPRAALERQIQTDRQKNGTYQKSGGRGVDRNAGTANAKRSGQYDGVGKVP
jgi:hypothetical protein